MTVRLLRPFTKVLRDDGEEIGRCHHGLGADLSAHFRKDAPELFALFCAQPVLASHARNSGIGFGAVDLPGVDHMLPFRQKELGRIPRQFRTLSDFLQKPPQLVAANQIGFSAADQSVKFAGSLLERRDYHTLLEMSVVGEKNSELSRQGGGQGIGEGRQQNPGVRIGLHDLCHTVQRHHCLAGACRSNDADRA